MPSFHCAVVKQIYHKVCSTMYIPQKVCTFLKRKVNCGWATDTFEAFTTNDNYENIHKIQHYFDELFYWELVFTSIFKIALQSSNHT